MKRIIVFFFFLFLTILSSYSITIKGKIIDTESKTPLDYVNVSVVETSSQAVIVGAVTDSLGLFSFDLFAGDYALQATFVGYKPYEKKISVTTFSTNIDLGTIRLRQDTELLREVEVVAQRDQMRMEIDKKKFGVDQNLVSAGASVTEVLQNIPSVDVDGEGNISLRNNSNVEVWINGKPAGLTEENRAKILEQMPAGSIESVELMTNPSVKYNPEGTAGVINLVMKKTKSKTYYGTISTGINWPTGGLPGGNLGFSINYNSSKVDVYTNLGIDYRSMIRGNDLKRYSLKNGIDTLSLLQTKSRTQNKILGFYLRTGINFHINSRNTIGLSGYGMPGKGKSSNAISYLFYNYLLSSTSVARQFLRNNKGQNKNSVYNAELYYKHDFLKKGSFIKTEISFGNYGRSSQTNYLQEELLGDTSTLTADETQYFSNKNLRVEAGVDFTYKFTEKRRIEAGWESKYSYRKNSSEAFNHLQQQAMVNFYNCFDYQEQIHALYATYGDMFGSFSMQLGLRGEYMNVKTHSISKIQAIVLPPREYFQLFPSVFFAYSFPKNHELQLNYTRRVNRPRGRQINPYKNFSDSTSISYGNPSLNPQFSSSLELNYLKIWDNHSLSASVYYKFTDNVIQRISFRNANVMENTYVNLTRQQSTGLELVAKNKLFKLLTLTSSVNLYYEKMDSAQYENSYGETIKFRGRSNFSWHVRFMASIMMTKTTSAQLTANYRAPQLIAQGKQNHDYSIDLGLRQTFLKGALSLSLTARDILDSRRFRSETWGSGFYQLSERFWSGRTIGFQLSYNFGNLKEKKKNRDKNESENQEGLEDMEL